MMQLRLGRSLHIDGIKSTFVRTFSSKSGGNGSKNTENDNEIRDKSETQENPNDLTEKINSLLKSMIEDNARVAANNAAKMARRNDDIGRNRINISKTKTAVPSSEEKIQKAAAAVADSLGGDKGQIEKELVSKAADYSPSNLNWSELIQGMQIDHSKSTSDYVTLSRSRQVQQVLARKKISYRPPSAGPQGSFKSLLRSQLQSVDLFAGQPMNIFTNTTNNTGVELKTWNSLEEYDAKLAVTHPPSNYFEKMIQWTDQGKLWKFPIDNEQGMEEEQNIHFSEHIFLESHLEDWCPKKGPIRHFMELVCIGLSKNPYVPAKDKREHIEWFKNYFESKKELLKEVGAYDNEQNPKSKKPQLTA